MPLIQFIERVVDFPVARQRRALTVLTVQKTFEILQVPFLGLVLDSPLLCFTGRGLRPCDHATTSSSSSRRRGATVQKTVEFSQVQFLEVVERPLLCNDKCVDVEVFKVGLEQSSAAFCGAYHLGFLG